MDINTAETQAKLKELLRGERSAVETYQQALEQVGDDPRVDDLLAVAAEHRHAVQKLEERLMSSGAQPSHDSGLWGLWAKTVMGTAKMIGDRASLAALKEGEEHGKALYLDFLQEDDLDPSCRDMIQNELLPQQIAHIQTLERIISKLTH